MGEQLQNDTRAFLIRAPLYVVAMATMVLLFSGCISSVEPFLRFDKAKGLGPSLGLNKSSLTVVEGTTETAEITLTAVQTIDTVVALSLTSLDASGRFQPLASQLTIPAGAISISVPLITIDDALVQSRQQWKLMIGVIGTTVATTQSELIINLDDNDGGTSGGGKSATGPILFKDFNQSPSAFASVALGNGKTIFAGSDATYGIEYWVSDGTAVGTFMLKDMAPGVANGVSNILYSDPLNSLVYFNAPFPNAADLWVTDGTIAGTKFVKTVGTAVGVFFKTVGTRTLFVGQSAATGSELWTTDGTSAGTYMLADFAPGTANSGFNGFVDFNGYVYFGTGVTRSELWRTDGTSAGTTLVKQMSAAAVSRLLQCPLVVGSTLYFQGYSVADGFQLWKSDGTTVGTVLVKKISTQGEGCPLAAIGSTVIASSYNAGFSMRLYASDGTSAGTIDLAPTISYSGGLEGLANGKFVYIGADANGVEPWITDGTPAGTTLLKDIAPGALHSFPRTMGQLANRVIFYAENATSGKEPWVTDGTPAGTFILKDIKAGTGSSNPADFVIAGTKLYFTATSNSGKELWVTDGTPAGTMEVIDLLPGSGGASPVSLTRSGSKLFFGAYNFGLGQASLFVSDGTSAGTNGLPNAKLRSGDSFVSVTELGTQAIYSSSYDGISALWAVDDGSTVPQKLIDGVANVLGVCNGSLYFHHYTDTGAIDGALQKTSGTAATTTVVKTGFETAFRSTCHAGKQMFVGNTAAEGPEPWITDGTLAGTTLVKATTAGTGSTFYTFSSNYNPTSGLTYFQDGNEELWVSDGTTAGTRLAMGDFATSSSYYYTFYHPIGNKTLVALEDPFDNFPNGSAELWFHDGAAAATRVLPVAGFKAQFSGSALYPVGGKYVFAGTDGTNGNEPWVTDGTNAGTFMLKDTVAGAGGGTRSSFVFIPFAGKIIFQSIGSAGIWITDGTVAGTTQLLAGGSLNATGGSPPAILGGYLYFGGYAASSGIELWRTDGTTLGTTMVADIDPGVANSLPLLMTVFNGKIYFSATTPEFGRELWVSDGTAAGTKLLTDINPGPAPSSPQQFQVAGGKLFMRATKVMIGTELFMMEP